MTQTYYPDTKGGIEEVVRQIALNTQPLGVETRVFTLSPNPNPSVLELDGVKVYRVPLTIKIASCGMSVSALRQFKYLIEWADIVNYHFPWPFMDLLHFLSEVEKKKTVLTYHSDVVSQKRLLKLYSPLMDRFLEQMDAIVATSGNYVESSHVLSRYRDKVSIIPIGISQKNYPTPSDQDLIAVEDQVGRDFFLFIGTFRKYKAIHVLLNAMKKTKLQCVIVGSGPGEKVLKDLAKRLELSNTVFLGRVSDVKKVSLIKLCRAVVLPSTLRSEAFGVVLLEGSMYKKPLISTELGTGTSFVNLDGKTGLVVPPSDVKALQESMLLLDRNKALATKMGQAAFERYNELFLGVRMGDKYAELYKTLNANR